MAKETLAKKLLKARTAAGLSMSEVSRMAVKKRTDPRNKITQGYISRLESGRETNPSFLKISTLCKIYNIDPGSLFQ
jgi:transcriptional regulator with XRE-family HTH domain